MVSAGGALCFDLFLFVVVLITITCVAQVYILGWLDVLHFTGERTFNRKNMYDRLDHGSKRYFPGSGHL